MGQIFGNRFFIWQCSVCVFLLIIGYITCQSQINVGDKCIVARIGSPGTCKIIDDCLEVINEIVEKAAYPTTCGSQDDKHIVCCTDSPSAVIRVSQRKCNEYRNVLDEKMSVAVGFNQREIDEDQIKCELGTVPELAKPQEFPHMAMISIEGVDGTGWQCAGALISDEFVLTTAYCSNPNGLGNASYIILGDPNYVYISTNDDSQPQIFTIVERIAHPDFKFPSKYNDIALLRLDRKATLNRYVRPACLTAQFQPLTNEVISTGWNRTHFQGSNFLALVKDLKKLFSHIECSKIYENTPHRFLTNGIVETTQLCAGSHEEQKDACDGDFIDLLQVYHAQQSCMYEIIGVASFDFGSGDGDEPRVYTRVSHYLDWIESIVWPTN